MLDLAVGTRYFESLDAMRGTARAVDLRALLGDAARGHANLATEHLAGASTLLRELGSLCETSTERAPSDDVRGLLRAIADVCFIAQTELNALSGQLQRCASRPQVAVVVTESVYRKLRRIASRTQWLLAPLVGRSADVAEQESEIVEGSVVVRRLYSAFRKAIRPCGDDDASVLPSMRAAAEAIATLLGDADVGELRVQDYQVLVDLQARIESWLRSAGSSASARNVHSDLSAFAELTRMVNRRQELRAHDAAMLESVLQHVFPAMLGDDVARRSLLDVLGALDGLDDELDALAARVQGDATEATYMRLSRRATELRDRNS